MPGSPSFLQYIIWWGSKPCGADTSPFVQQIDAMPHCGTEGCGDRFGMVLPIDAPTPRLFAERYDLAPGKPPPLPQTRDAELEGELKYRLIEVGEGGTFVEVHGKSRDPAIMEWGLRVRAPHRLPYYDSLPYRHFDFMLEVTVSSRVLRGRAMAKTGPGTAARYGYRRKLPCNANVDDHRTGFTTVVLMRWAMGRRMSWGYRAGTQSKQLECWLRCSSGLASVLLS